MNRSQLFFENGYQKHSLHKHKILEKYFLSWGHKLGLRRGAEDVLLFVDGCAGRGADEVGNDGSPIIAARAAAAAMASINSRRAKPLRIDVVAIEKDASHSRDLSTLLAPFGAGVRVVRSSLDEALPSIEGEYAGVRALYFVDPFGLEPLKAGAIRRILNGKRNEVLLLFADMAAVRHYGVVATGETGAERRHRKASSEPSLFDEQHAQELESLESKAVKSRVALESTRAVSRKILDDVFGGSEWASRIESTPREFRRDEFIALYAEKLLSWGAAYVLRIPIVAAGGTHVYTLMHASVHPSAYVAMKEAVATALNQSPLPHDVVERMKRSVESDIGEIASAVRARFAGRTVDWAENEVDRNADSIRRFALQETSAFPFEMDKIKARLKQFRETGRKQTYTFPPAER